MGQYSKLIYLNREESGIAAVGWHTYNLLRPAASSCPLKRLGGERDILRRVRGAKLSTASLIPRKMAIDSRESPIHGVRNVFNDLLQNPTEEGIQEIFLGLSTLFQRIALSSKSNTAVELELGKVGQGQCGEPESPQGILCHCGEGLKVDDNKIEMLSRRDSSDDADPFRSTEHLFAAIFKPSERAISKSQSEDVASCSATRELWDPREYLRNRGFSDRELVDFEEYGASRFLPISS